jgi:hypothetical protein
MTVPSAILGPAPAAGYPTAIVRTPQVTVAWGTAQASQPTAITGVLEASTDLGLDMSVGEATFTVPTVGDLHGATFWSVVKVLLAAGGSPTPWLGYITDLAYQLYPRAVVVTCKSFLVRADQQVNTTPGGTLFFTPGLGSPDENQVNSALSASGLSLLSGMNLAINGTGRTLGSIATEPFRWAEGESALSFIRRFDEVCAVQQGGPGGPFLLYRTYDDLGGYIKRSPIDMVPSGSAALTFTEGVDIYEGSGQQSILPARNKVIVTGYDQGLGPGPVTNTQSGANAYIPNPPQYVVLQQSSPMIEFATIADLSGGNGMACEMVAKALLRLWNRTQQRVSFTTPRDDDVAIGATITVDTASHSADRLGVQGNFYVEHVHRAITPQGEFSQVLTCLSGAS